MDHCVGDQVRVNDPGWHAHGAVGTVVKVNRKTVRVKIDEVTTVVGAPQFFEAL